VQVPTICDSAWVGRFDRITIHRPRPVAISFSRPIRLPVAIVGYSLVTGDAPKPGLSVGGHWVVGSNGTNAPAGCGHALNVGPSATTSQTIYMPRAGPSVLDPNLYDPNKSNYDRLWGPSSDHAGGIVNHVYGDGHIEGISDTIDANVYLWIVTRSGGEAIPK
jgi:hypothetical protein